MAIGVVGRKAGMTRIFTDEGQALPVTVIEVEPNRIEINTVYFSFRVGRGMGPRT